MNTLPRDESNKCGGVGRDGKKEERERKEGRERLRERGERENEKIQSSLQSQQPCWYTTGSPLDVSPVALEVKS